MFAAIRAAYDIPREDNLKLRDFPIWSRDRFVYDRRPDLKPAEPRPVASGVQPLAGARSAILKEHRGMDVISRDALRKVLQIVREVQKSGIMLLMVKHVTQNPSWKPLVRTHREKIVEPYLSKVKAEAETTAAKVARGKRNDKLEELARAVFGSGAVSKLTHYSENSNPEFTQKMLGGFQYVAALNYLRAFLVDYLPKSVGRSWTCSLSRASGPIASRPSKCPRHSISY